MKAVISLAARMSSSRLPGKVMAEVAGRPILQLIVERLRPANAEIVIANNGMDPEIAALAARLGVRYVAAPVDVMDIHHRVLIQSDADVLLLAGADDPLLDPVVFNLLLDRMRPGDVAYSKSQGWPLGLNAWAVTRAALWEAQRFATAPDERQHVVPFWERRPRTYPKAVILRGGEDLYDKYRLTVDTPSDLDLVSHIYHLMGRTDFSAEEAIALLEHNPGIAKINADGLQGTAARDAIYPDLRPVDTDGWRAGDLVPQPTLLADIRHHVAVSREAALGSIGDYGDFARGQAAAMLSMDQWLEHRASR